MRIILPDRVRECYEFCSYDNALEILAACHENEFNELVGCLENLEFSFNDLLQAGGNKSPMPKKLDDLLFPLGWREVRITADLHVIIQQRNSRSGPRMFVPDTTDEMVVKGFLDGHNIDFVKNGVALDMEWNSKDQTFDRDLLAFRAYYDARIIDVGIIITRAAEINDLIRFIEQRYNSNLIKKYGASTTWMGKLLPRLDARRNGGCPVLAIGIKSGVFSYDI